MRKEKKGKWGVKKKRGEQKTEITPNRTAHWTRKDQRQLAPCRSTPRRHNYPYGPKTRYTFLLPLFPPPSPLLISFTANYSTHIIGKWGLGDNGTTGVPNLKGFDQWFGYLDQLAAHDYYPETLWNNTELYPKIKRVLKWRVRGKGEI
jgi:hypothetical protein